MYVINPSYTNDKPTWLSMGDPSGPTKQHADATVDQVTGTLQLL